MWSNGCGWHSGLREVVPAGTRSAISIGAGSGKTRLPLQLRCDSDGGAGGIDAKDTERAQDTEGAEGSPRRLGAVRAAFRAEDSLRTPRALRAGLLESARM